MRENKFLAGIVERYGEMLTYYEGWKALGYPPSLVTTAIEAAAILTYLENQETYHVPTHDR